MRVLGIDYGERRIGLAISDPTATIATPLSVLTRRRGKRPPVAAILNIVQERDVQAVVVGLPLNLAGDETDWTREVRAFGDAIERRSGLRVEYADERMTSVAAERAVRSLGLKRSERERKDRIDTAAALLILQGWLNRAKGGKGDD